jgi:hypothetical protein
MKDDTGRIVLSFAAAVMEYVITLLGGSAANLGQGICGPASFLLPTVTACQSLAVQLAPSRFCLLLPAAPWPSGYL